MQCSDHRGVTGRVWSASEAVYVWLCIVPGCTRGHGSAPAAPAASSVMLAAMTAANMIVRRRRQRQRTALVAADPLPGIPQPPLTGSVSVPMVVKTRRVHRACQVFHLTQLDPRLTRPRDATW